MNDGDSHTTTKLKSKSKTSSKTGKKTKQDFLSAMKISELKELAERLSVSLKKDMKKSDIVTELAKKKTKAELGLGTASEKSTTESTAPSAQKVKASRSKKSLNITRMVDDNTRLYQVYQDIASMSGKLDDSQRRKLEDLMKQADELQLTVEKHHGMIRQHFKVVFNTEE